MESKKINFNIYRYHLLPLSTKSNQIEMFEKQTISYEELRDKKNSFFKEILDNLTVSKSNVNPLQLFHQENDFYLFKLAQKKVTTITQNFENLVIDNEPYVYVIVNNNPNVQKIAISENLEAFSRTEVVKNILKKVMLKELSRYGLNIEIEPIFDSVNFWKYVAKHKHEIKYINFEFIKPNLANISNRLPEDFKKFAENVNSHESHLTIKAPEKGVLDNIEKSNKTIAGLVEYSANGGGGIKLKIKNIRKQLNTKENPVTLKIDELDIEGATEQVIKLYQTIVNEDN